MLSKADQAVVARDPQLPGLALLLDEERTLAAARREWPADELLSLRCSYLRYKPGISCLAGYAAETESGPRWFHAKVRATGNADGDAGPSPVEGELTLRRFPSDRELRGLAGFLEPDRRHKLLRKMLPAEPQFWSASVETLRYKPERRWVGRITNAAGEQALVKLYEQRDFRSALQGVSAFVGREHLMIARRRGRSKRHRIIVTDWINGAPLDGVIRDGSLSAGDAGQVGKALAELHRQTGRRLPVVGREQEAVQVLAAVSNLHHLRPDLADAGVALALRVCSELVRPGVGLVPIHGDFSADQVIWGPDGIAIVDLDRACWGDPLADLGNFLAGLEYDVVRGHLSRDRAADVGEALTAGYQRRSRRRLRPGLDLQVAAGLLRLVPQPFRTRDPEWPAHLEALLRRAEHFLAMHASLSVVLPAGSVRKVSPR